METTRILEILAEALKSILCENLPRFAEMTNESEKSCLLSFYKQIKLAFFQVLKTSEVSLCVVTQQILTKPVKM